jgi:hypothetical protein
MTEPNVREPTVHCNGSVSVRVRPSELLLKTRLRVNESTLELRLSKLKKLRQMTVERLKCLGAKRVEFGDPYFSSQADKDPLKRMLPTARALTRPPDGGSGRDRARDVEVMATALWDISAMTAEETLILMDRLWFEIIPERDVAETRETDLQSSRWTSEANAQEIVNQVMRRLEPGEESVQFLCISRLNERQLDEAAAKAYFQAHQQADCLARASGKRLGELLTINSLNRHVDVMRPDRMMDRQRCMAILSGTSYEMGENEIVFDDACAVDFTVHVSCSFGLK